VPLKGIENGIPNMVILEVFLYT